MQPVVRLFAVIWYFIYIGIAVYGCFQLREGLEPVNLLVEDSYAIPHYRTLEQYFWHYGASLQVLYYLDCIERCFFWFQIVVNNAPDMRNLADRNRLREMAHEFANTRHSIGDASIQFWLFEMDRYYKSLNDPINILNTTKNFYELTRNFFLAKNTDFWPDDVKWTKFEDGTFGIKAFR